MIGSAGDLRFIKGHHLIIKAAPLILQEFPDAVFVFVGADFTNGELQRHANETGFSDHFRFAGFRFDAVRFMSAIDVLVQPSLSEGLPRAILEAMSLSKPVIGSGVGGIPEIIQ
ncbi:glycosyltransferase family 4 protein, partial [bacterium]|nr:glycosyltransferase family 4 protein [bacterium]